jgi:hypothetical protein
LRYLLNSERKMQQQSVRQQISLPSRIESRLWLVVQFVEGSRVFELSTSAEAPLAFGGSVHADVQIDAEVPFAFFLERDTRGVWLVPADPKNELFANRCKVTGRTQIYDCTVVSYYGFGMVLWVRDSVPTLRHLPAVNMLSEAHRRTTSVHAMTKSKGTGNELASAHSSNHLSHQTKPFPIVTSECEEIDFDGWCKLGDVQAERLYADVMEGYDEGTSLRRHEPINSSEDLPEDLAPPELSGARIRRANWLTQYRFERPLEKIGILTTRHPIGAIGAALIGTLLFLFFLVGATQLLQNALHEAHLENQTTVSPET